MHKQSNAQAAIGGGTESAQKASTSLFSEKENALAPPIIHMKRDIKSNLVLVDYITNFCQCQLVIVIFCGKGTFFSYVIIKNSTRVL